VLHAATLGGAKALGWNERIGSLEPGKLADMTAIRLDAIETQPMYNVISQLIYAAGRHQVSDVWIAGERKLAARMTIHLDAAELREKARRWRDRLANSQE